MIRKLLLHLRQGLLLCSLAVSSFAADADQHDPVWKPLGLSGGGGMFAPSVSPHDGNLMMLACDMSSDYISRDGGQNWESVHHSFLQSSITCPALFDPVKPNVIYAPDGRDNSLKISTDYGRTWQPAGAHTPWEAQMQRLYMDGGNFFVSTDSDLWLSADHFKSWAKCKGIADGLMGICADRTRKGVYVAGTKRGIFLSEDNGKSFSRIAQSLPERKITGFAGGSDGRHTMLYAAVECGSEQGKLSGGIYASADGGRTWQSVMNPDLNVQTKRSSEWANGKIAKYRFLMTTDRAPDRVYAYCPGTSYYPPNHNTVYRSDDAGKTWKAVFFSDPRFTGIYNVEDDRETLAQGRRDQEEPFDMEINPGDPDTLLMATDMFLFYTQDGGKSWKSSQGGKPVKQGKSNAWACNGLTVTTTWNYYIDPFDPQRHFICYTDLGLSHSVDGGKTWIWDASAIPWKNTTYELAFDPAVKGRVWGAFSETHDIPNDNIISEHHPVTPEGGVAVSDDHGETWKKLNLPEGPCVSVVLDPSSPENGRTLYASIFEKGVYKSTDGGKTWTRKSDGLGSDHNMRCCRLILHKGGALFCLVTAKKTNRNVYDTEGAGIYRSTDGAATWTKINASLPLAWPKDFTVKPDDSQTVLVGAGRVHGHDESGLYRTKDGGKTWNLLVRKGSEHFGATYDPSHPGWIYMTLCEGADDAGLYLSRDDGQTWTPFKSLPFCNIMRVQFDPADPGSIILTTFGSSVLRGPADP